MELETVNRLYLELSQFATARTAKENLLLEALRDAHAALQGAAIVHRSGEMDADAVRALKAINKFEKM